MLEGQCFTPRQFAIPLTELLSLLLKVILLFREGGLKFLQLALAVREGLLALTECLVLLRSGGSLLACQLGAVILDFHPLALDGVAFRSQFLGFELLFEFALAVGGLVVFLLKLGNFFRDIRRVLVAASGD